MWRSRWAAVGAAVAVTMGAGGLGFARAAVDSGDRPVTVTIEPARILDTRVDLGLTGRFVDATPRDLTVSGAVDVASGGTATVVPTGAVAALVNVTVVNPDGKGYLSLRPAGAPGVPTTSTVNFAGGSTEPNAATVDLAGGAIQIYLDTDAPGGTAHVLVDVVGYTIDHTHDDRYPTHDELDEAVRRARSFSVDPRSVRISGSALQPPSQPIPYYGLALPDAGTASFDFGFVLPVDYVAGDPVRIVFTWHVDEAACGFELMPYYTSLARAGSAVMEFNQNLVPALQRSNAANIAHHLTFELVPPTGTGFEPGDAMLVDYYRGGGTCTETVYIDGIQVRYG